MTRPGGERRGVAAVEFALIAPALLGLLFLCLDGAWQGMTAATLDRAAREASRYGATGSAFPPYLPSTTTTGLTPRSAEAMAAVAVHFGGGILRAERLSISLESAADVLQLGTAAASPGSAGNPGESTLYSFRYEQPPLTPMLRAALGPVVVHRARALVRNEPFPVAQPGQEETEE